MTSYPKVNPYDPWSGIASARYYRREEWFDCPCCPPNLARLVASIGDYFYSTAADALYVHLYNQNRARFSVGGNTVQIEQQTDYPWNGDIHFTINGDQPAQFTLALRIPGWCRDFQVHVNGARVIEPVTKGYVRLRRTWSNGDEVTLSLDMPVERMMARPEVRQDAGCIALQRGPVVYCLEEADNGPRLANVAVPRDARLMPEFDAALFGGVGVITGDAVRIELAHWPGGLYQPQSAVQAALSPFAFKAIPYCFWANREPGEMRVWMRES